MYSNKENVNILTALLVAHGVRHAVVCPGSRNAPVVHNLNECPDIRCYPVTDERSAGFYALGMSQCLHEPVAVCVTSGTALLNLAPAVAEAYYQHVPLVAISADRPPQWIDQLDGQTMPQPDALGRFVCKAVTLPEPHDGESRWYCNRLVNEALLERRGPVHINVPITEPLFDFTTAVLPTERSIELMPADMPPHVLSHLCRMFMQSKRPMLIAGQPMNPHLDEAAYLVMDDERYVPDLVVYTGGSIVSKRLKHFLRKAKETWVVNATGDVTDTFQNVTRVFVGDGAVVADQLRFMLEQQPHPFVQLWDDLLAKVRSQAEAYEPAYSEMAVVKYFESQLSTVIAKPHSQSENCHCEATLAKRELSLRSHTRKARIVNSLRQQLCHSSGEYLCRASCVVQSRRQRHRGLAQHGGRLLLRDGRAGVLRRWRPQFLLRPERAVEPEPAWQPAHPAAEQWQGRHLPHAAWSGAKRCPRHVRCRRAPYYGRGHLPAEPCALSEGYEYGRDARGCRHPDA